MFKIGRIDDFLDPSNTFQWKVEHRGDSYKLAHEVVTHVLTKIIVPAMESKDVLTLIEEVAGILDSTHECKCSKDE